MPLKEEFLNLDVGPVALKMAVAVGIGMLIGLERDWSHKEAGIRTFAIVSLAGMLAAQINNSMIIMGMVAVCLLLLIANVRSFLTDRNSELTTSAVLVANYILGVLVGLGHIFTPVAGTIIITMLLAWKTELTRFAGGLQTSEIRSAILLGLIGFVIYPLLPNRYIDPWQLFNPSDAWISIIAIAGIGFLNYVLLRVFSSKGLYLGAIFGGLVNSTATIAEVTDRIRQAGTPWKVTMLACMINIAMFVRNMVLAAMFVPLSLTATLLPLLAMSAVAGIWIWHDFRAGPEQPAADKALELRSPIAIRKILSFGLLFVLIQAGGILLTRAFGGSGMLATGFFGGLVSSASTTAAAATMAMHGSISPGIAGSTAIISSMASALINFPIVWRQLKDRKLVRSFTFKQMAVLGAGVLAVLLDQLLHISEFLVRSLE